MAERVSIDGCPRLDTFLLHRRGALVDGAVTRWQWPLPIGTTTVVARADGERLLMSVNGAPEVAHSIIRKPGTLGASYPFIECCERSQRYLYVLGARVGCRFCHQLAYPSQMPRQWNAAQRRLNRARARLAEIEAEISSLRRKRGLKRVEVVP